MSEYKCPVPGCNFHIGIAGQCITDEDFEQQDYYFEEIEEHEQMHEEQKHMANGESVERISAGRLSALHVGSRVRVLGEALELQRFTMERNGGSVRVNMTLLRGVDTASGLVPESLFWDVQASSVIELVMVPQAAVARQETVAVQPLRVSERNWLMRWFRRLLRRGSL